MSWIAADADLPNKSKVRQIGRSIGVDRFSVAGRLIVVWAWFDKETADGFMRGATAADLDDFAAHDGFADAMALVGWLEISDDGLRIPDFEDHHGNSAKKRASGALRMQRYRKRKSDASSVTRDAPDVTETSTDTQIGDASVTFDASPHNNTEQNKEKEQEPRAREIETERELTPAALACIAMRKSGVTGFNPSHPELIAAIAEGATTAEFEHTARELAAKGRHSFAYVVATVRRRKAEAAAPVQPQAQPNRHKSAEQTKREAAARRREHVTGTPAAFAQIASGLGIGK